MASFHVPKGALTSTSAKPVMLAATGADIDVDVGRVLLLAAFPGFNEVVLRMAATASNLLILLQRMDVFRRQQGQQLGYRVPLADQNMSHDYAMVNREAPKSNVIVSPVATVKVAP